MNQPNGQLLAKIWRPIHRQFNDSIESACLRRDAYLDHVFAHEAKVLAEEIPFRNSPQARAYLQSQLEELERIPVNFSLNPATIKAVNRACEGLNVIRDCFINRVLFLLLADLDTCAKVTNLPLREAIPEILGEHDRDYIYASLSGGSLSAVAEIAASDPFWALRNFIDHFREQKKKDVKALHACLIPPALTKRPGVMALNCYLADESIPKSQAAAKRETERLDEILGIPKKSAGRSGPKKAGKKAK